MKTQLPISFARKSLPLVVAAMLGLTACSGEQAGDTNGGLVGGVGGISGTTALGVIGGVALAGLLLSSDDDDGSTANDGAGDGGGDDGDGDGGGDDGGGDDGGGDDGGGDDGGGDDGGGDDGGGDDGGGGGGPTPDETVTGTPTNTAGEGFLTDDGVFQEQLIPANAVADTAVTSTGFGDADLIFNRSNGQASGTVTLTGVSADRVDLMVGPPGTNGFVAVALENPSGDGTTWSLPTTLSSEQTMFILQNLNSGNLYVSASNAAYPDGEVRKQLLPGEVVQYSTGRVTGSNGATAEGYVLVNPVTGHYAITWNTSDASLVSAHLNDNVINGSTESNYVPLTQRTSNPMRFFLDGNYLDANDPLYPDLLTRLDDDLVWLDAHSVDDTRVFQDLVSGN